MFRVVNYNRSIEMIPPLSSSSFLGGGDDDAAGESNDVATEKEASGGHEATGKRLKPKSSWVIPGGSGEQGMGSYDAFERRSGGGIPVVEVVDFGGEEVGYEEGAEFMMGKFEGLREEARYRNRNAPPSSSSSSPRDFNSLNSLILLTHSPTYTIGTSRSSPSGPPPLLPHRTVSTGRGGDVTYHGPGQLVAYPILDLTDFNRDVHWYVRALEEVVIRSVNVACGDDGGGDVVGRVAGQTGVFTSRTPEPLKVASVGVKLRSYCSCHGVSVNVERGSVGPFGFIDVCGVRGMEVCCLEDLGWRDGVEGFKGAFRDAFKDVFQCELEGGE